MKAISLAWLK